MNSNSMLLNWMAKTLSKRNAPQSQQSSVRFNSLLKPLNLASSIVNNTNLKTEFNLRIQWSLFSYLQNYNGLLEFQSLPLHRIFFSLTGQVPHSFLRSTPLTQSTSQQLFTGKRSLVWTDQREQILHKCCGSCLISCVHFEESILFFMIFVMFQVWQIML